MSRYVVVTRLNSRDLDLNFLTRIACMYCSKFNTNWHCSPNGLKLGTTLKLINRFTKVYLLVFYFPIVERFLKIKEKVVSNIQAFSLAIMQVENFARRETSNVVKYFRKFGYVFSTGGACNKCRQCNYLIGKPCRYPNELMYSPETSGLYIYKTLMKIGIPFEHPVRNYMVKVGLVLTNNVIDSEVVEKLDKTSYVVVNSDELRSRDIYKLLNIDKKINIASNHGNVLSKFVKVSEDYLLNVINNIDSTQCKNCKFFNICSRLREKIELMKIGNEETKIIFYKTRTWNVNDLYRFWHFHSQKNPLTIVMGSKIIKKGNKHVVICNKLLNIKLNEDEIAVVTT